VATGLYFYCLREPVGTLPEIKAAAVDGEERVTVRAFEGVEAVVSAMNLDDFGKMQTKAREDVHWIREKAVAHEMVVEEAMGKLTDHSVPVIPIRFGVIFNTEERLTEVISGQSTAIRTAFDRIRGKQEWSVKVFLKDARKFKDQVKKQTEKLREKSKELASLPDGMAYFMEQELDEELERECSRKLDEEAMQAFEDLKRFAAEAAICKILDKELTGRSERMVLNSAYLVANIHLREFQDAVAKLREKFAPLGFLLEQSGPWPPYHFTEFAHD
jgi:hypothetical protein